jgi:hypothetical protein
VVQLAERELYAQDYLFKASLMKKTGTLMSMWKIPESTKAPVAQSIVKRGAAKASASVIQGRANSLLLDQMMSEQIKKERKKGKK